MPGVPSGRGCDACRRQKKKCGSLQPPCSRCKRLGIPCIGLGKQRYVFRDEGEKLLVSINKQSNVNECIVSLSDDSRKLNDSLPFRNPSNALSMLRSAVIDKVSPDTDVRIQLLFNFGFYLGDIPRRLGANEALDAAAETLVAAHAHFCAGNYSPSPELLAKHSRTLNILRYYLNDPVKAHSSETLCAVMLLMICQILTISNNSRAISHSEGAVQILKCRGYSGPRDDFERKLLATLRGPVVVEAILEDNISISPQEWTDLVENPLDGASVDEQMFRCLARTPLLMRRGQEILHGSSVADSAYLALIDEVETLRNKCGSVIAELRGRLTALDRGGIPNSRGGNGLAVWGHAHFTRTHGLGLTAGIITNCILGALKQDSTYLRTESDQYAKEILVLAEAVSRYRPLGSAYMVLCLGIAWVGAADASTKADIKASLFNFEQGYLGTSARDRAAELTRLDRRLFLKDRVTVPTHLT